VSRVCIILVNWNGWRDTLECLESLLCLEYPNFKIVVCDNGSCDDSRDQIRLWADKHAVSFAEYMHDEAVSADIGSNDAVLTLISIADNLGFAGGNNVGLRYCLVQGGFRYYWLLNNDTTVEPDALAHLAARMQDDQTVGICGSTIRLYHNHRKIQALGGGYYCRWVGLPWHYGRFIHWGKKISQEKAEARMNYVEGASMLVSSQFLEQTGLLCEDYFLYFEEADWAIRAKGRFRMGYASQSVVYHKVGSSIGTSSNPMKISYTSEYFNIRNRLLFTRRFYPAALPTVWLVIAGAFLVRLCVGKWDRARMILRLLCTGK
jgi:GT2 family glycosyltransferase